MLNLPPWVRCAFAALVVATVIWLGLSLPPPEYPQQKEATQQGPDEIVGQRANEERIADATIGMEVFTAILAISTIGLWIATWRSASVAENALTQLERPHLRFTAGKNTARPFSNYVKHWVSGAAVLKAEVKFTFTNFGKYPAFVQEFYHSFEPLDSPPAAGTATKSVLAGDPIIGQDGKTIEITDWIVRDFTPEEISSMNAGKLKIWLHGKIVYGNVIGLGEGFITEFLWLFDPQKGEFRPFTEAGPRRNRCT